MTLYHQVIWGYFILVNAIGFLSMGVDKYRAKKQLWRIPEKRLFLWALAGGAIGIWVGGRVFRHKTRHKLFIYGIPLLIAWNVLLVGFLLMKLL